MCDGDGHSLLAFLEQSSMELVLQSERIVNNLTLLEHRVTLAGDSGQAAELSVDTRAGHLSGLSAGFDVGE